MNGYDGQEMVTVLYKVVNSESDRRGGLYNAFQMPRGGGTTLVSVKQHCAALNHLNHLGAEGYHWRVCIEDKQPPSSSNKHPFSWWDVQDEKARLPVKEFSMSQVDAMFMSTSISSETSSESPSPKSSAKSFTKGLGKAMNAVAHVVEGTTTTDSGPRVPIIAFKLLDLVKMHDEFAQRNGGSSEYAPAVVNRAPKTRRSPAPPAATRAQPTTRTPPAAHNNQSHHHRQVNPAQPPRPVAPSRPPVGRRAPNQTPTSNLMDFGAPAPATPSPATSMSSSSYKNETRAERLKREYAQKQQKANRVWDDVDQRWVEVDPKAGVKKGTQSAPPRPSAQSSSKKVVGIKLDTSSAVGKSATVQAAVHSRVNEMKESQQKAVAEIREREMKKQASEQAEDEVRRRLEPMIKKWSEEHGKKKQLRALLASLHTILWPGANWKQMSIGDLLDDSKVKKAFHKASRVVHPDKTGDLDAEKRFLAKRIFDALSQAKTEFDNGAK